MMVELAKEPMESIKSIMAEIDATLNESNEIGFTILESIKCGPDPRANPGKHETKCMYDGVMEIRERSFMIRNQLSEIRRMLFE